jgi:methyl-accepting chemotaxis protein
MSMSHLSGGLRGIRLRGRLLTAFLLMSVLIGLCGLAGLTFVNRIGSTVEVATGVAAPLANDSAGLLAGAQRAREALRVALDSTHETASSQGIEEIARVESDSRAGIERMRVLIARASLELKVDHVTASLSAFSDEARKILEADRLHDAKLLNLELRFKSFETNRNELEASLAKLAAANEATMGLREDSTKALINSGSAKIDDFGEALDETFTNAYPNVKDAYKLIRNVVELQELARGHMSATDEAGLKSIEQRAEKLLKASLALHRRFATRLKDADLKAESTRIGEGFNRAGALLSGDGGAFAARRAALSDQRQLESLKVALSKADHGYVTALGTVDEVTRRLSDGAKSAAANSISEASWSLSLIIVAGTIAALVLGILVSQAIVKPMARLTTAIQGLARGELDIVVPERRQRDEIREIGDTLVVFKANMIEADRLRGEQETQRQRMQQEGRRAMLDLAAKFEASVGGIVEGVVAKATELQGTAQAMAATAEETSRQSTAVAATSVQTTQSVQIVATATDELSAASREIAEQVTQSGGLIDEAVQQANVSNEQMKGLTAAAERIGDVVKTIAAIAGQTNLLALNATIESARAGDAGRGFAVVASEVKALATETAKATDEIGVQIRAIQEAAQTSAGSIEGIARMIGKVNVTATAIASAVEEQSVAMREITSHVQQAAQGTHQVSDNISSVSQAARDTGAAAAEVLASANEFGENGSALKDQVDAFLRELRVA